MNKIAHFIVYSKAAPYLAALLYIVMWVSRAVPTGGVCISGCLGLLLMLVMGYLSVRVAREYLFSDGKNALPATLLFMGCAIEPQVAPLHGNGMLSILFAIACYVLLQTYRNRNAMGSYFLAFALVGALCLGLPSLWLVLPCLVLCGTFMESLHVRTFFAALWGLLFPCWIVVGVLFVIDRVDLIVYYFEQELPSIAKVSEVLSSPLQWAQLVWVLLLALPSSVMILLNHSMKLQASAGFRLLIASLVLLLIAIGLFPSCYSALSPCVLLCTSLVGATLFAGNTNRARNIYLFVLLILWFFLLGWQTWSNYQIY